MIILNCAECEPLFRLHRQLLKRYSFEIISTLDKMCQCIGAKEFHIAMKRGYKTTAEAVERDIQAFKNGKTDYLYEVYPAGDEIVLIHDVTGKTVPAGGLPIDVGVIVYNVETVLNIYYALQGEKVTHKYVTVGGAVKNPQTYRVPIGTPLTHLVKLSGGATEENTAILSGGPMTGRIAKETETAIKKAQDSCVHANLQKIFNKEKISNQIMKGWFPKYDNSIGGYSLETLFEKGQYAMTDEEVITAKSSAKSLESFATTLGYQLIDRSYVICYLINTMLLVNRYIVYLASTKSDTAIEEYGWHCVQTAKLLIEKWLPV